MKKQINVFINWVLNNLVMVRKNRLVYNLAVEEGTMENKLSNRIIFSIIYNLRFIFHFFLLYFIWGLFSQLFFSHGEICLDENLGDTYNRLLYILFYPFTLLIPLFALFKTMDVLYLISKFIKNLIKK